MRELKHLFDRNREWAAEMTRQDPEFFARLAGQQAPEYLWIGCSDSRVPANQIVGLLPGEMFVHRNVANVVVHSDLNCLSVVQFATDVLKVQHIIVVGHSGCGGVSAALSDRRVGVADNWLRHVKDVILKHDAWLQTVPPERRRLVLLREIVLAYGVLLVFFFAGNYLLKFLGLEQESISIAGGIVLFLIALRMIFPAEASMTTEVEGEPFLVPLAIPLIAGPSTLAALLLLQRSAPGQTVSLFLAVTIAWAISGFSVSKPSR